jgi:integrase/recombinase XerC
MPPADWPEIDRRLWRAASAAAGPFDDEGRAAAWSEATRRACESAYGTWLGWLRDTGALDPRQRPVERISKERVGAFMEAYARGRSELTIASTVHRIGLLVRAMEPPDGCPWLTKRGAGMVNRAEPSRPKLPRMAAIPEIIAASERIMHDGLRFTEDDRAAGPILYRDGLIIGLLSRRPLRRRNLAGLRLGQNFIVDAPRMRIVLGSGDTKKGVPFEARLPQDLETAFSLYLSRMRPRLLRDRPDEGWLWLSRSGARLSEESLSHRVLAATRTYLGRDLSPHLFRDCVATEVAIADPAHVGIARALLGHAAEKSSQRFYNQATSFTAVSRHEEVIRRLRRGS